MVQNGIQKCDSQEEKIEFLAYGYKTFSQSYIRDQKILCWCLANVKPLCFIYRFAAVEMFFFELPVKSGPEQSPALRQVRPRSTLDKSGRETWDIPGPEAYFGQVRP